MRASLCLLLLPAFTHAHRYALCHFSCVGANTNETWRTCRSEKCTPRLPEDLCADGNEPALLDASGVEATDEAGVRVSGPQECADVYDAPLPGSFAERCDLCMGLVGELRGLWYEATQAAAEEEPPPVAEQPAAAMEAPAEVGDGDGEGSSAATTPPSAPCAKAAARTAALLPTIRTCRYHPPACEAVLAAARERACPQLWEMRVSGATERAVRAQQRQLCGALVTQRNASGVDEAVVCPHPRDVGERVMGICAVMASVLLAAQVSIGIGRLR